METNTGGYDRMGYAYLASWLGPVNESDDRYTIGEVLSPVMNSIFHIQNVLFLTRTTYTDNDEIKRAIMSYGAVSTCIHMYQSSSDGADHYRNGKNLYWYRTDKGSNHAVAIVGWDDTYSKDNFKTAPPGDGAWIIKNSWGTNSGENGYYYVSYYDTCLAPLNSPYSTYVFMFNDSIKYDKNYQYDVSGRTDFFLNASDTVWYKNRFIASDNEYLTAVSTYFEKNTNWDLSIYVNNVLRHTQSGFSTPSYSTIELSNYIPLNIGDVFEVVFKITVDKDAGVPISEDIISSGVPINKQLFHENISFISYDGESWTDLFNLTWEYQNSTYSSQVACIKAFTVLEEIGTSLELSIENRKDSTAVIVAHALNQWGYPLSGNVTFHVADQTYVIKLENGFAKIDISFLNASLSAEYSAVGYNSSRVELELHNPLVETSIDFTVSGQYNPLNITAIIVDSKGNNARFGHVKFIIDGEEYVVKVSNGTAGLENISVLPLKLNVSVFYSDSFYYGSCNATKSIEMTRINTRIAFNITSSSDANNPVKANVSVTDFDGNPVRSGKVKLNISGTSYSLEVIDGYASVTHTFLSTGNKTINASFSDVYLYSSSNAI
jgi:hypothetical protein